MPVRVGSPSRFIGSFHFHDHFALQGLSRYFLRIDSICERQDGFSKMNRFMVTWYVLLPRPVVLVLHGYPKQATNDTMAG